MVLFIYGMAAVEAQTVRLGTYSVLAWREVGLRTRLMIDVGARYYPHLLLLRTEYRKHVPRTPPQTLQKSSLKFSMVLVLSVPPVFQVPEIVSFSVITIICGTIPEFHGPNRRQVMQCNRS